MNVRTLYFEINNTCNLNCRTCYNRSGIQKTPKELPLFHILKVIEDYRRFGLKQVLFSGGEPTLYSEFDQLVEFILGYDDRISFGIVTNGTQKTKSILSLLQSEKKIKFQISLDGASEQTNCLTRGAGHFNDVIDFLSLPRGKNITTILRITLSKVNIVDIEAFYHLAIEKNCIPEFAFAARMGNADRFWKELELSDEEKAAAATRIYSLEAQYGISSLFSACSFSCPLLYEDSEYAFCIKYDGFIQPCQFLYHPSFFVGNILDFDYKTIEKNIKQLQLQFKSRLLQDFGCKNCFIKNVCGKGCPAVAWLNHRNVLSDDEDCDLRKQIASFEIKKQAFNKVRKGVKNETVERPQAYCPFSRRT